MLFMQIDVLKKFAFVLSIHVFSVKIYEIEVRSTCLTCAVKTSVESILKVY